ncbi:hypothetical protein DFH27DRAFT_528643 [Peziza echinospora]|nr:hypothetical protein DFH27DRAFT_528643 [Peziza echinospora]
MRQSRGGLWAAGLVTAAFVRICEEIATLQVYGLTHTELQQGSNKVAVVCSELSTCRRYTHPKLQTSWGGVAAVRLGEGCYTAPRPCHYAPTGTCHHVPSDVTSPVVLPTRHPMATISAQTRGDDRLLAGDYSWMYVTIEENTARHSTTAVDP